MPKAVPEGFIRRIASVHGVVKSIKGLHRQGLFKYSYPYCIVKGIRSNSNLVDLFTTEEKERTSNPQFNEEWSYDCSGSSEDDFVGLKFVVFNGDDFLGGVDVDISELLSGQDSHYELELEGIVQLKQTSSRSLVKPKKKPRIYLSIRIERVNMRRPGSSAENKRDRIRTFTRALEIRGRVGKLENQSGQHRPICIVRAAFLNGDVEEVFRTRSLEDGERSFNEIFNAVFKFDEEPIILVFDLFSSDAHGDPTSHLGSAWVPVASILEAPLTQNTQNGIVTDLHPGRQILELRRASLYEKWLDRTGKKGQAYQTITRDPRTISGVPKKKGLFSRLTSSASYNEHGRSDTDALLVVFLVSERIKEPMPFLHLLGTKQVVEEDDATIDAPDDKELLDTFASTKSRRLVLSGEDRIFLIHGRVKGASDLISTSALDKSDPYVIVEAVTMDGDTYFMYRTRYITDTLNPIWDEAFFFVVPPEHGKTAPVSINKLLFSVYDCDDIVAKDAANTSDDFLGRCNVDISGLSNGESKKESVPLLGMQAGPGGVKPSGGFRRYSTISVEIYVERRIHRTIVPQTDVDSELLKVTRHKESREMRPPLVRGYVDISQTQVEPPDKTPGQVLDLRESGSLLQLAIANKEDTARDQQWLQARPIAKRLKPPPAVSIMEAMEKEFAKRAAAGPAKTIDEDDPYWRFDDACRKPPVVRTSSLPNIRSGTRFGHRYAEMTAGLFDHGAPDWRAATIPPWKPSDGWKTQLSLHRRPALGVFTLRDNASEESLMRSTL